MKTGIWGAGNIAHTHAEALKASGIAIGAVVDVSEEKARAFAEAYGIEAWGNDPALLLKEDITTVHVCTPPNLHYEMVSLLLDHKKNVLCEKPLCFDDREAEELEKKAREQGVHCAINLNVRFHMAWQKARKLVMSQDFGRVNLIHGSYLQEFNAFPAPLDWRYNTALAGQMRAVTEIGTHWLDIAQYISGLRITSLSASFGRLYPKRYVEGQNMFPDSDDGRRTEKIEVSSEDAACVSLKFENGAIGALLLSEVSQGKINRLSLEVTGEKKNLWWNSEDNNILNTAKKGEGVHSEIFGFGNGFMDTFREGMNVVKLCNAMLKSADSEGRWVDVH